LWDEEDAGAAGAFSSACLLIASKRETKSI